jgi:Ras-related protein Rab-18
MYKQVKILLIGDNFTSKSSLIQRYVDDTFDDNIQNTIGFDFKIKKV